MFFLLLFKYLLFLKDLKNVEIIAKCLSTVPLHCKFPQSFCMATEVMIERKLNAWSEAKYCNEAAQGAQITQLACKRGNNFK